MHIDFVLLSQCKLIMSQLLVVILLLLLLLLMMMLLPLLLLMMLLLLLMESWNGLTGTWLSCTRGFTRLGCIM